MVLALSKHKNIGKYTVLAFQSPQSHVKCMVLALSGPEDIVNYMAFGFTKPQNRVKYMVLALSEPQSIGVLASQGHKTM